MLPRGIVAAHNGQDCILVSVEGPITDRAKMYAFDAGIGYRQSFRYAAGGCNGAGRNESMAVNINTDKGIVFMTESLQSGHGKKSTFSLGLLKGHRAELGAGDFFQESGKIRQMLDHVSAAARYIAENNDVQAQSLTV